MTREEYPQVCDHLRSLLLPENIVVTGGSLVGVADAGDFPGEPSSRINNRKTILKKVPPTPLPTPVPYTMSAFSSFMNAPAKNLRADISKIINSRSCSLYEHAEENPL